MTESPDFRKRPSPFEPCAPRVAAAKHWGRSTSITVMFGIGPKNTLKCGECGETWKARIPYLGQPWRQCPACQTWNYVGVQWK